MCLAQADIPKRLMEVRCDLPDFICRMLAAERRSGNQIFAHRQSPDDDGFETNLSDETRRDIHSVRVVAGDRNSDEFALPVRVRRHLAEPIALKARTVCAPRNFAVAKPAPPCSSTHLTIPAPSRRAIGLLTSITSTFFASVLP